MKTISLVAIICGLVACQSNEHKTSDVPLAPKTLSPSPTSSVVVREVEVFTIEMAKTKIAETATSFNDSMKGNEWTRRVATFRSFDEALDKAATVMDVSNYRSKQFTEAKTELQNYDMVQKTYDEESGESSSVPTKPTFSKPSYTGVFALQGTYKGPYDGGGVVVESNGQLYLIKDVSCINGFGNNCPPGGWFDAGYVERTGLTMTLNLGRYGRDAEILRDSNRETYDDDQQAYRAEVATAQQEYNDAMKDYQKSLTEFNSHDGKHKATKNKLVAATNVLNAKFMELAKVLQ